MAGPIRTFIDTLQERQPVRNALRSVLGMPQRRGTVIDSFEEMAARDREMGGDISNAYPNTRMDPRIASTATAGPSGAAGLPAPQAAPEMIATPAPVDPSQPLAGMGMMQGVFTPPSDGAKRQSGTPARQVSQQGGDLSASTRAISQSAQTPEEQARAQAQLYYNAALQPGLDPDRRKSYMRVAENFHKQEMSMYSTRTGNDLMALVSNDATNAANVNAATSDRVMENMLAQIDRAGEISAGLMTNEQKARSRATAAADDLSALVANPTLSLADHANASKLALGSMYVQEKTPRDPVAEKQEYDRAFESGLGFRLSQYSKEGSPAAFGPKHPTFPEVANHFRQELAANPKNYDMIAAKVRGIVAASAGVQLSQHKPGYAVQAYIDGVTADIIGPKPPSQLSIFNLFGGGK